MCLWWRESLCPSHRCPSDTSSQQNSAFLFTRASRTASCCSLRSSSALLSILRSPLSPSAQLHFRIPDRKSLKLSSCGSAKPRRPAVYSKRTRRCSGGSPPSCVSLQPSHCFLFEVGTDASRSTRRFK